MAEKEKTESQVINAAAEAMKVLGGEPLADEIIPDNEPVPKEDLEEVDENASDKDESTDDKGGEEGDDDSTPEEKDEKPVDKDDDEVAKDDDAGKADEQKDKPQLSDAYYRAAINSGMDEKEIVDFYAANPELAAKTFAKLHDNMNSLSNEYAALGKHKKEQVADEKVKNTDSEESSFEKIDLAKLKEEFPEDSLVDVIGKMQDQMQGMDKELKSRPTVANSDASAVENERVRQIGSQIESFFNSDDTQRYSTLYGTVGKTDQDWSNLLPSEQVNRVAVCERAEEIVAGAGVLGREMEFSEALERAHLEISRPVQEKIIRKDIMAQVVKRSKGITLKPSSEARVGTEEEKPNTEKGIIASADARLKKVFSR